MRNQLFAFALLLTSWSPVVAQQTHVSDDEVVVQDVTTQVRTYFGEGRTEQPVLVVALHGDAPFNNPSYQYAFAKLIAAQAPNTIGVGLLRPGYTDGEDRRSDGIRGDTVGDNYDAPRIGQIAAAIQQLEAHYNAGKIILAGHSGGSAITAKLIAAYPDLIDHAFVVSCPCNINAWREDMTKLSGYEGFRGPLDVVSPVDVVADISDETSVSIFVGDKDKTTQEYLSREYFEKLIGQNKKTTLTVLDGEHNIFLHKKIIASVVEAIASLNNN